jgi:hypothetical protein
MVVACLFEPTHQFQSFGTNFTIFGCCCRTRQPVLHSLSKLVCHKHMTQIISHNFLQGSQVSNVVAFFVACCSKVLVSHHSVCKHYNVHPPRPPWPPPCCGHRELNKNNNNSFELLFGRCSHRFCCSTISKSPGKVFLHRSSMSLCSWRFETTLANTFPTKCAVGARGSRATHRQSRNGESKSRKILCFSRGVDGLLETLCICRSSRRNSGEVRREDLPRIASFT